MHQRTPHALTTAIITLAIVVSYASLANAQQQSDTSQQIKGITWTVLQHVTLASMPAKEEMMGIAEIAPGVAVERHSHAEYEIGYVLQGEFDLETDGAATRTFRAGESYSIPAGKVHRAKNNGSEPVKVLAIYIVGKGWPLAKPAP